jgi:hypothetical protein
MWADAVLRKKYGVDLRAGAKARVAMMLVNSDFAIEPARPLPPNVVLVGPLGLDQPKALPPDLKAGPPPPQTLAARGDLMHTSLISRPLWLHLRIFDVHLMGARVLKVGV